MSLLLSDKQIKDKWLKDYMAEIKFNQERKEYEVNLFNIKYNKNLI